MHWPHKPRVVENIIKFNYDQSKPIYDIQDRV